MSKLSDRVIAALEEHKGLLLPVIRKLMAEAWAEGRESVDFDSCGLNPYLPVDPPCKIKAGAKEQDNGGSEAVRPR